MTPAATEVFTLDLLSYTEPPFVDRAFQTTKGCNTFSRRNYSYTQSTATEKNDTRANTENKALRQKQADTSLLCVLQFV